MRWPCTIITSLYTKTTNAGVLRFDCQILDGQKVENKLQKLIFYIYLHLVMGNFQKIHLETSQDIGRNIDWTKDFMR